MVTSAAGALVEGDKILSPDGKWLEVKRSALTEGGTKIRLLLDGLKPMTWPADFRVECERGQTGQAIDLLMGAFGGEVSSCGDA